MDQGSLRRLRELEAENGRLKKIVAQQAIDLDALKDLVGKAETIGSTFGRTLQQGLDLL